jgi:hypothetical protein
MPVALPASNRDAKLQILQTHQQSVQGVGVGAGGGGVSGGSVYTATNTTPCSQPFPDDATAIDAPGGGSLSQCTFAVPGAGVTGSAQVTYIKAILTTEAGSPYYVYLSCWKQYGTCTPLKENQTYLAKLSESAEQLADYAHRQVSTPISVSLRPDGKHKVTYTVLFVTKAPPQP